MNTRPTVTEEQVTEASRTFQVSVQRLGNKACCQQGKIACMCQPENHGGKGACGKVINADSPTAPAEVRQQVLDRLAEIRAGPHSIRTVH
jgi:hypothetical protein